MCMCMCMCMCMSCMGFRVYLTLKPSDPTLTLAPYL